MSSRRKGGDLILFSSEDPQPLIGWLVDTFGLQTVLQALSNHMPGEVAAPTRRASKKGGKRRGRPRGSKKGSKKGGAKKGSKKAGGKSGKGRGATSSRSEVGNY